MVSVLLEYIDLWLLLNNSYADIILDGLIKIMWVVLEYSVCIYFLQISNSYVYSGRILCSGIT